MMLFEPLGMTSVMYDSGLIRNGQFSGKLDAAGSLLWFSPVEASYTNIIVIAEIPNQEILDGIYHTETHEIRGLLFAKSNNARTKWAECIFQNNVFVVLDGANWKIVQLQ